MICAVDFAWKEGFLHLPLVLPVHVDVAPCLVVNERQLIWCRADDFAILLVDPGVVVMALAGCETVSRK